MNVAWSLSYEWFFYLSLPLAVAVTGLYNRPRWQRVAMIAAVGALFLIALYTFPERFFVPFAEGRTCHVRAIIFLGGMLVYELTETTRINGSLGWGGRIVAASIVFAGGALPVLSYLGSGILPSSPVDSVRAEVFDSASLLVGYSILVFVVLKMNIWKTLFEWTPLRWLGNMSYSFYLLHGVPLHVLAVIMARSHVSQLGFSRTLGIFVFGILPAFVLTTGCCVSLFVLVEKRLSLQPHPLRRRSVCRVSPMTREQVLLTASNS